MIKRNESFTINQNDISLSNVFVRVSEVHPSSGTSVPEWGAQWPGGISNFTNAFSNSRPGGGNVICIAVDTLPDDRIAYCIQMAEQGRRVYLLLGDKERNEPAIQRLAGTCLIRTGVLQYGSLLLQDGNSSNAKAWVYPTDAMADLAKVEAGSDAVKWLYQTFCYLFWKEAKHEITSQDKSPKGLTQRDNPVVELQVDEPYARPGKLFDTLREDLRGEPDSVDILCSMKNSGWILDVLPSGKQCQNLLFTVQNGEEQLPDIEDICKSAQNISISESHDIGRHNIIYGRKTYHLPKYIGYEGVNWVHVEKTDGSRDRISSTPIHWRLKNTCKLGDLAAGTTIRFADQPSIIYRLESRKEEDLGVIIAKHIDDYLEKSPEAFCHENALLEFNRDRLASEISYIVEIRPPALPSGAKCDDLESQWESVQREWKERLTKLEQDLAKSEEGRSQWGSKIRAHLSQFIIGQDQKISEYRREISDLRSTNLGQTSSGEREQKWEKYLELHQNVARLMKRTGEEKKLAEEFLKWKTDEENLIQKLAELQERFSKESDEKKKEDFGKQIERLEEDVGKHQSNRPKSAPGGISDQFGKVLGITEKEQPKKLSYPSEDLPLSEGSLYRDVNRRYLVITSLERIDLAKKDAERLNAKICVKAE